MFTSEDRRIYLYTWESERNKPVIIDQIIDRVSNNS